MAKQTKTTSKVVANTTIGGTPAIAAASLVGKVVAPQVKKIDEELLQAAGDVQAEQVVAVDAAPASVGFELAQAAGAAAGSTGAAAGAGAGAAGMSIGTIAAIGAGVAVAANASKSSSSTAAATTTTTTTTTAAAPIALTANQDNKFGTSANDTFTATDLTLTAGDVIADSSTTDSDVLNVAVTANTLAAGAAVTIVGVENVNFNYDTALKTTTNASGISGSVVTVNQTRANGAIDADVSNVGNVTVKAGTGVTGAFNVTSAAAASNVVIDAGSAVSVAVATVTTGSATVTGGSRLATVSTIGKTATITTAASSSSITLEGVGTADVATISGGTAVTLDSDAAGGTATTGVETLNLSGNGGATTVTLGTVAAPAATVNFTGTNDVTYVGTGAQITGATITDNTTGAAKTTVSISATGGAVDLSKNVGVDKYIVTAVTAGDDLKLAATGTVVQVDATANALDLVSAAAASTTTDSVTVIGSGATTVLGNGTASTGAGTDVFDTVNYSSSKASGANALTATLGTNTTLNITGTKDVTLDATSTAKAVVADAAYSGKLSVTYDNANDIATVTGGLGDDTFTATTAPATKVTINGGGGNDTFTLLTASKAAIDGGSGYDTISAVGDLGAVTFTGVEKLAITGAVTDAVVSQFTGKPLLISGNSAFAFGTTAANLDASTVDLSGLIFDTAAAVTGITLDVSGGMATTIAAATGLTFTGSSIADTVTGTGNVDTISTGAGDDVIVGGAGADILTGGEGADTITGGAGADVINLAETTAAIDKVAVNLAAEYGDTVTNFAAGTGIDVIQLKQALAGSANNTLDAGGTVASVSGGVITKASVDIDGGKEAALISGTVNAAASNKVAAADIADATKVAALLGDTVTIVEGTAIATAEIALFVVEASDSTSTAASFAVWSWTQGSATDVTIGASELTLVGKFTGTGTVTLADITLIA